MDEEHSNNLEIQLGQHVTMKKSVEKNRDYWLKIMHTRYPVYIKLIKKYKKNGKLLDVGCGNADIWYEEYVKPNNFTYYGTDLSKDVVEHMSSLDTSKETEIYFKEGVLEELPWPDKMFDVVYASHILEHSTNISKAFSEIKRVLKSDGIFLFAVPCGYDNEPAHIHNREYEEWIEDFSENNMSILDSGRFDFNLNEFHGIAIAKR